MLYMLLCMGEYVYLRNYIYIYIYARVNDVMVIAEIYDAVCFSLHANALGKSMKPFVLS